MQKPTDFGFFYKKTDETVISYVQYVILYRVGGENFGLSMH
jgi:hypothetical protein